MPIKLLPAIAGNPEWGDIAGNIEFQSDLNNIFSQKSEINHNHNLNDLTEKSYLNLNDLPDLSVFSSIVNTSQKQVCYELDGTDDYIEIKHSSNLDVSSNFAIILSISIDEISEYVVLAAKGDRNDNKSWTIFCDFGTVSVSIGNGTNYFTASHLKLINQGQVYRIVFSYDNSSGIALLSIDNDVQTFDFSGLGNPIANSENILIGKNPANGNCYKIGLYSFFIFQTSLLPAKILQIFNNNLENYSAKIFFSNLLKIGLIGNYFGKYFWFDISGLENHAIISSNLSPKLRAEEIIIPIKFADDDFDLINSIPRGYSIEYISIFNHSINLLDITIDVNSLTIVNETGITNDEEIVSSVHKMISAYNNSDLHIYLNGDDIECDIIIFLKRQIAELV
jgi:hypothetical protein